MANTPQSDENTPKTPQTESVWRFAWVLLWVLPLALSWDFVRFLTAYHFYHERAQAGLEQMTIAPDPNEVLVVLTGDMGRIPRALELLKVRGSQKLIISGAAKGVGLADLVNQQGASTENLHTVWKRIVLESKSASTVENALCTFELLKGRDVGRIVLITSDYHMGRSLAVFRSYFPMFEIVPYAVTSTAGGRYGNAFWKTGAEYWKSLFYRLSLWINPKTS